MSFRILLTKACSGDQDAAAELVRHYQPHVHRFVHFRLADWHLRRQFDSLDVCQAVFADFFLRLAQGNLQLNSPEQLMALLVTMARNVLVKNAHSQQAARRDVRRLLDRHVDELDVAADEATPSQALAQKELLTAIGEGMVPEEAALVEQWLAGKSWAEIGRQFACPPDAARMRLQRLLARLRREHL